MERKHTSSLMRILLIVLVIGVLTLSLAACDAEGGENGGEEGGVEEPLNGEGGVGEGEGGVDEGEGGVGGD